MLDSSMKPTLRAARPFFTQDPHSGTPPSSAASCRSLIRSAGAIVNPARLHCTSRISPRLIATRSAMPFDPADLTT